jgi:arylsulfatase A-like enzyme
MSKRILVTWLFYAVFASSSVEGEQRPNVIMVITDDQGYGDIGIHGNSMIQTPHLDRLHGESVRLTDFHVDPTCSPSRSALMSGRYSTRTGVWHTIQGRSLMASREVTLAEMFRDGGYRTAMFGKWHLGDNYPCRPQDQGFDETFYHGGGGVGQTPDYFGNDYFDDVYFRDGIPERVAGYCTDVWFEQALAFIERSAPGRAPFFAYLSTNAPHGPLLVDEKYSQPYVEKGVAENMAKFYGMITNIDENMGRLLATLDTLAIRNDTILIFLTDNGSSMGLRGKRKTRETADVWPGFNAAMRGRKGSEYDGGHRVPCFVRWPSGGIHGGREVRDLAAHVDLLPTLADLCGLDRPAQVKLDGQSLADLLRGVRHTLPERTLFVHSQRMEFPEKWRKAAVMTSRYRLINGRELYDIRADPGQESDIAPANADLVARLRAEYESWWTSLTEGFDDYVRLAIGSDHENPTTLTAHDWHTHDRPVPWNHGHIRRGLDAEGFWAVDVVRSGLYQLTLRRWPKEQSGGLEAVEARLQMAGKELVQKVSPEAKYAIFRLELPAGPTRLETWLTSAVGKKRGAYFVDVQRLGD